MEIGAQPGNDNSARGKEWTLAIKRALARKGAGDYRRGLDRVADKVIEAAEGGDTQAWKEVGDRFDGKPVQSIANENPDSPFIIQVIKFADAKTPA